jgi:hypothetical protein
VLYQLSYTHRRSNSNRTVTELSPDSSRDSKISQRRIHLCTDHNSRVLSLMARQKGFEPLTRGLEGRCSSPSELLALLVGATGFEPATPCAQGRCATRLRHAPTSP